MVEAIPTARSLRRDLGPIGRESHMRLAPRSDAELQVIPAFLAEGRLMQTEHASRIADLARHPSRPQQ